MSCLVFPPQGLIRETGEGGEHGEEREWRIHSHKGKHERNQKKEKDSWRDYCTGAHRRAVPCFQLHIISRQVHWVFSELVGVDMSGRVRNQKHNPCTDSTWESLLKCSAV